jgi:hypothetical protein
VAKVRKRILRYMTLGCFSAAALVWVGTAFGSSAAATEHGGAANAQNVLGATANTGGVLPFTGLGLFAIVAVALGLLAVGISVRRVSRTRA